MKTIFKYALANAATVGGALSVPDGAKPLCVQMQNNIPCLWMLVDSERPHVMRRFAVYGTGHELPQNPGEYVGTFQDGWLVFHVFMK